MSVAALSWVLTHSSSRLGDRLVLIALADHADDNGANACPSQQTIATKAGMSVRQVRRCLGNLCKDGHIEEVGTSEWGTMIYTVSLEERGEDNLSGADKSDTNRSDLSYELKDLELQQPSRNNTPTPYSPPPSGWKVDRKAVTPAEADLAGDVLDAWNSETGQSLRSKDWLAKIVMRIREHPELALPEHAHVIHVALDDPWWSGPPNPSVVYGNGAQFERCIERVRAGPLPRREKRFGRGMTTEQILAMRGGGGDEGRRSDGSGTAQRGIPERGS